MPVAICLSVDDIILMFSYVMWNLHVDRIKNFSSKITGNANWDKEFEDNTFMDMQICL